MKNKLSNSNNWVFFFFLLILVLNISCSNSTGDHTTNSPKHDHKDSLQLKPPSSFSDSMVIDFPAVVFYNPDSLQFEKLKSITEPKLFESIMHDYFYQARNSRIVLKKYYPHIRIIEITNARYLLFKKAGGEKECVDLDTKNDPYGAFIFNGRKNPQPVDMTNIETELRFYFSE